MLCIWSKRTKSGKEPFNYFGLLGTPLCSTTANSRLGVRWFPWSLSYEVHDQLAPLSMSLIFKGMHFLEDTVFKQKSITSSGTQSVPIAAGKTDHIET